MCCRSGGTAVFCPGNALTASFLDIYYVAELTAAGNGFAGGTMIYLQYKGRIHKGKFTSRSIGYILSDQAARLFPALQRRWLFPVESQPIAEAAREIFPIHSLVADAPPPACFDGLGLRPPCPVQQTHSVYFVDDAAVTGWAGAIVKNGLLLTVYPDHNWVSAIRLRPYRTRTLPASRQYFNLMAPIPARGHIFHWLFDSILPFIALVESGRAGKELA